jgi:hypothetical protein
MNAPFTQQTLFALAARYNQFIEPLQILIYIPTLLIFVLLLRGTKQDTSRGVLLLLGAEWAMVGVLFFFNIVVREHWIGYVCGAGFLAAGLFYAIAASYSFPPHFRWRRDNPSLVSIFITAFGIMGYPGLSWLLGRHYPLVTTYGLMPGSVALLTLGVLVSARPAPRLWLMIPPLGLALLSPLSIWWWQMWEDFALIPLAVIAVIAWLKWRSKLEGAPTKDTIRFDF